MNDLPPQDGIEPMDENAGDGQIPDAMADMIANAEPSMGSDQADFEELPDTGTQAGDPAALSLLYDLSLPVAIELGRTRMSVQEILAIGRGSVIQLERLAGEPIDVFVGDRRFAEGEVVVVGEQFGVRVTRILAPNLRLDQQKGAEA